MSEYEQVVTGMLIQVSNERYIMPIKFIKRFFKAEKENIFTDTNENAMISVSDGVHAVVHLRNCIGLPDDGTSILQKMVIQLESKGRSLCLIADSLAGERQFTLLPLPALYDGGKFILGCSIFEDEGLYLVLNAESFFEGMPELSDSEPYDNESELDSLTFSPDDDDTSKNMFLTFEIKGEDYIISLTDTKEISTRCPLVRAPDSPVFLEGILDMRGEVVPVINLRKRFSMPVNEDTSSESIIFITRNNLSVGLIVDKINDAVGINKSDISIPPNTSNGYLNPFVSRIAYVDKKIFFLLDWDKVLQI